MKNIFKKLLAPIAIALILNNPALSANKSTLVTFHFYGAEDCPPCMAFKNDYLPGVTKEGEAHGFDVKTNVIQKTENVPKEGSYGEADKMLRLAESGLSQVYPPIFFITKDQIVQSVHGPNWRSALKAAKSLAASLYRTNISKQ